MTRRTMAAVKESGRGVYIETHAAPGQKRLAQVEADRLSRRERISPTVY